MSEKDLYQRIMDRIADTLSDCASLGDKELKNKLINKTATYLKQVRREFKKGENKCKRTA